MVAGDYKRQVYVGQDVLLGCLKFEDDAPIHRASIYITWCGSKISCLVKAGPSGEALR
jgi:hypothetical protein